MRGFVGRDPRDRLRAFVEGEQRDDRKARRVANRLDRVDDLLEVVERLDHEQVGAPAFENGRLLGEDLAAQARCHRFAERTDRAAYEDVATCHLACLARELDRRRVDLLEPVLEEVMRELAAVRAERVRLDQLGARVDEADVQRDDRFRCAEVRFLGTAQTRNRGREERAHASVGDDRGAATQAFEETTGGLGCGHLAVSFAFARHIHPGLTARPGLAPCPCGAGCRGVAGPVPSASLDAERGMPASGAESSEGGCQASLGR